MSQPPTSPQTTSQQQSTSQPTSQQPTSQQPTSQQTTSQQTTAPERRQSRLPAPAGRLSAPVVVQFVKFGIVGVSNTLLAFAVYTLLLKVFGVWYVAASGIGFAVGAVNGFLLNRRWTFSEHVGDALTPLRWAVVQSGGLACNLGLVYLFVDGLGLDELVGQIPTTVIVTVLTFAVNRAWTFKMHPPAALLLEGSTAGSTAGDG